MSAFVDVHTRITNQIIAQLEAGVRPWQQSWTSREAARPCRATGEAYRGVNIILLWMAAASGGYTGATWMTYRQAESLGGQVRRGEKGTMVVYAGSFSRDDTNNEGAADGSGTERGKDRRRGAFLKSYTVFNVDQIDGLPEHFRPAPMPANCEDENRVAAADGFVSATGATIRHGGSRAYYSPSEDLIQLPTFADFESAEAYYATQLHELVHWTSHPKRLARDFGRQRWGDMGYAQEELVAELGAAFLCADLGLSAEPRADHASYIGSWLKVLRNDKRAILTAATAAQKAADYLSEFQHAERAAA